jgi:hypothetical protein
MITSALAPGITGVDGDDGLVYAWVFPGTKESIAYQPEQGDYQNQNRCQNWPLYAEF